MIKEKIHSEDFFKKNLSQHANTKPTTTPTIPPRKAPHYAHFIVIPGHAPAVHNQTTCSATVS